MAGAPEGLQGVPRGRAPDEGEAAAALPQIEHTPSTVPASAAAAGAGAGVGAAAASDRLPEVAQRRGSSVGDAAGRRPSLPYVADSDDPGGSTPDAEGAGGGGGEVAALDAAATTKGGLGSVITTASLLRAMTPPRQREGQGAAAVTTESLLRAATPPPPPQQREDQTAPAPAPAVTTESLLRTASPPPPPAPAVTTESLLRAATPPPQRRSSSSGGTQQHAPEASASPAPAAAPAGVGVDGSTKGGQHRGTEGGSPVVATPPRPASSPPPGRAAHEEGALSAALRAEQHAAAIREARFAEEAAAAAKLAAAAKARETAERETAAKKERAAQLNKLRKKQSPPKLPKAERASAKKYPQPPKMPPAKTVAAALQRGLQARDDNAVCDALRGVNGSAAWDDVRRSFAEEYPGEHSGQLVAALAAGLSAEGLRRGSEILKSNGVDDDLSTAPDSADAIAGGLRAALGGGGDGGGCGSKDIAALHTCLGRVAGRGAWRGALAAFAAKHPDFYNGDALAALQAELTPAELAVCEAILQGNGVDMGVVAASAPGGPQPPARPDAPAIADGIHVAVFAGDGKDVAAVHALLNDVGTLTLWRDVLGCFQSRYPEAYSGDLVRGLRAELTGVEFSKCEEILRGNGVAVDAEGGSSREDMTDREDLEGGGGDASALQAAASGDAQSGGGAAREQDGGGGDAQEGQPPQNHEDQGLLDTGGPQQQRIPDPDTDAVPAHAPGATHSDATGNATADGAVGGAPETTSGGDDNAVDAPPPAVDEDDETHDAPASSMPHTPPSEPPAARLVEAPAPAAEEAAPRVAAAAAAPDPAAGGEAEVANEDTAFQRGGEGAAGIMQGEEGPRPTTGRVDAAHVEAPDVDTDRTLTEDAVVTSAAAAAAAAPKGTDTDGSGVGGAGTEGNAVEPAAGMGPAHTPLLDSRGTGPTRSALPTANGVEAANPDPAVPAPHGPSPAAAEPARAAGAEAVAAPADIADALYTAVHAFSPDEEEVYDQLARVRGTPHWRGVLEAFAAGYPGYYRGDAIRALKDKLSEGEFAKCKAILKGNGVDVYVKGVEPPGSQSQSHQAPRSKDVAYPPAGGDGRGGSPTGPKHPPSQSWTITSQEYDMREALDGSRGGVGGGANRPGTSGGLSSFGSTWDQTRGSGANAPLDFTSFLPLPTGVDEESRARRRQLFEVLDVSGTGKISLAELSRGVRDVLQIDHVFNECRYGVMAAFRAGAKDSPHGVITRRNFRAALLALEGYLNAWEVYCGLVGVSVGTPRSTADAVTPALHVDDFCAAAAVLRAKGIAVDYPESEFLAFTGGREEIHFPEFAEWLLARLHRASRYTHVPVGGRNGHDHAPEVLDIDAASGAVDPQLLPRPPSLSHSGSRTVPQDPRSTERASSPTRAAWGGVGGTIAHASVPITVGANPRLSGYAAAGARGRSASPGDAAGRRRPASRGGGYTPARPASRSRSRSRSPLAIARSPSPQTHPTMHGINAGVGGGDWTVRFYQSEDTLGDYGDIHAVHRLLEGDFDGAAEGNFLVLQTLMAEALFPVCSAAHLSRSGHVRKMIARSYAAVLADDADIQRLFLTSYENTLRCLGCSLNTTTGDVVNESSRFGVLASRRHGHFTRLVTRMLYSLDTFNMTHFQGPLVDMLVDEMALCPSMLGCRDACLSQWIPAVDDRRCQVALSQKVNLLDAPSSGSGAAAVKGRLRGGGGGGVAKIRARSPSPGGPAARGRSRSPGAPRGTGTAAAEARLGATFPLRAKDGGRLRHGGGGNARPGSANAAHGRPTPERAQRAWVSPAHKHLPVRLEEDPECYRLVVLGTPDRVRATINVMNVQVRVLPPTQSEGDVDDPHGRVLIDDLQDFFEYAERTVELARPIFPNTAAKNGWGTRHTVFTLAKIPDGATEM